MNFQQFYTPLAESSKFIFYILLAVLIVIGLIKKRQANNGSWAAWIHTAVYLNFLVGGVYSGLRMLSTNPIEAMLTRRMFAFEAWFCFTSASFYFLFLYLFSNRRRDINNTVN